MTIEERPVADYAGTGLTVASIPWRTGVQAYRRTGVQACRAAAAENMLGSRIAVAQGRQPCPYRRLRDCSAAARHRLGFIFLSTEDETGISNIIIHPDLYEQERMLVSIGKFLLIEGRLQNEDTTVHVKASRVEHLSVTAVEVRSHDFH